ncbi:sugar transferase [Leptospira interrogans]|uniref:sugar transferase n=1 Tax=Leptospira interrogans TaxID=173 RepID=UPI003B75BDAA
MGYRGRIFTLYKFRTMYVEKKGKGFTQGENDLRITKIGKKNKAAIKSIKRFIVS